MQENAFSTDIHTQEMTFPWQHQWWDIQNTIIRALVRFFRTENLKLDYHIKCIVTEKICKLVKGFKQTKCRWLVWTAVISGQWCWTKWKAKLRRFWLLVCWTWFSKDGTGTEWGCTCSKESCVPSAFSSHWWPKQVWVLCGHLKFTSWACLENSLMKMIWVWNSYEIHMFELQTETLSLMWWLYSDDCYLTS